MNDLSTGYHICLLIRDPLCIECVMNVYVINTLGYIFHLLTLLLTPLTYKYRFKTDTLTSLRNKNSIINVVLISVHL